MKVFLAGLTVALSASAGLAQEQQNPTQKQTPETKERHRPFGRGEGRGFWGERGPRGLFDPRLTRELNLTDDQRRQIGEVLANNFESTRSQRGQLGELMDKRMQGTITADEQARAKALREQLQTSIKDSQAKIAAILTAEQQAKLEAIMKERRENRERFGERRRGGFPKPNQDNPPSPKPGTTPNN